MGFKDIALGYCHFRLLIGGIISIVIGLILIMYSSNTLTSKEMDTSNYSSVVATVKSAKPMSFNKRVSDGWLLKKNKTIYKLELLLEYIVDSKMYTTKAQHPIVYSTVEEATSDIPNIETVKLFYNPKDASQTTVNQHHEDKLATTLTLLAVLMIIGGGISIAYRKSKFFCGATIITDIANLASD